MRMKDRLKSLYPHLIAIAIFLVAGCVYFMPALKGYRLKQSDMHQAAGMAHEAQSVKEETGKEVYWTNSMFGGMPTTQISVEYSGNVSSSLHNFIEYSLPQPIGIWLMYAIGFYILMVSLKVNRWLSVVGALAFAFSTYFIIILEVGHVTKAMAIGFMPVIFAGFIWAYRGKFLLGATVTAIGMALECYSNHLQVTYYLVFMLFFFVVAQLVEAIREKTIGNFIKASVFSLVGILIGVATNFGNIYNTYVYGKYTNRGQTELTIKADGASNKDIATTGLDREYVTQYSYGKDESFTFLVPNFKGGASGSLIKSMDDINKIQDPVFKNQVIERYQNRGYINTYWGDQLGTSGPVYIGAGVCLLFVLGMFFVQGTLRWVMLATAVLALMLGWGKNLMGFTNFFLDHVPGYNKFRAVTIILILVELCLPVMAFVFFNDLINNPEKYEQQKKKILYVSGGLVALLLIFLAAPGILTFISEQESQEMAAMAAQATASGKADAVPAIQGYVNALKEVRIGVFKADVMRSLFFVIATAAVVYAIAARKLKSTYAIIALGLLMLIDLVPVNKRYLSNEKTNGTYSNWEEVKDTKYPFPPSQADLDILNKELQQKPELVAAIDKKIEKRKQEKMAKGEPAAIDAAEMGAIQFSVLNANTDYRVWNQTVSTFSDASTSYFHKSLGGYHGAKLKRYLEIIEFYFSQGVSMPVINMLNTKYVITQNGVQMNPTACGNVWFVQNVKQVENADKEIVALKDFDPKMTAVVDKRFAADLKAFTFDSTASIALKKYSPNELQYESNASKEQLAVFSEIYYEAGWNAYVDGQKVPHFRTDYILRGMMVPAGKHTIDFKFEPESVKIGENVSLAGSIMLLLLVGATVAMGVRKKDGGEEV